MRICRNLKTNIFGVFTKQQITFVFKTPGNPVGTFKTRGQNYSRKKKNNGRMLSKIRPQQVNIGPNEFKPPGDSMVIQMVFIPKSMAN